MDSDFNNAINSILDGEDNEALKTITDSPIPSLIEKACFDSVPVLSLIVSAYRIGKTISETFKLKKLARFLLSFQNGIKDVKRQKFKDRMQDDKVFARKQLDYLLIIIERYLQEEKAEVLSKLFLAYLDEKITWDKFLSYSVSLDFLMIEDIKLLSRFRISVYPYGNENSSSIARLVVSGFFIEGMPKTGFIEENNALVIKQPSFREYVLTDDGHIFNECMENY